MKLINLLLILSLTFLVSCGGGDSKGDDESGPEETEVADSDGEDEEPEQEEDFSLEDSDDDSKKEEELVVEDDKKEEKSDQESSEELTITEEPESGGGEEMAMSGDTSSYTVKEGDTLMLIAFKIYGDYGKWKQIANANSGVNSTGLSVGQKLKYPAPASPFNWSPKGNPYLIKSGDTLGTISNDKYGTPSKWKDLWNNNRPMIKDPNLIFAGFTLYYVGDSEEGGMDDF